ncbi:MAG: hypothetical protein COA54_02550 [Thiotrichaceae bacterium]|nr:MAG: hypothetical protein COA54_02550 [Thiotrichaceae bacterium]
MPLPTKTWTVPVAAQQDPAVPITSSWGNNVKNNEQFLMEWLGADFLADAAQNHNHDGVNSAKVDVLQGLMPNGSFQQISAGLPIGWEATEFIGGTVASSTAVNKHGDTVLAITSTILANGGGQLLQDEFKAVTDNKRYGFEIYRWASVGNVSCSCELIWYDASKSQISSTVLFLDASTSLVASLHSATVTSPANARFVRVLITGGLPAQGTAVGTVYFDGGRVVETLPNNVVNGAAIEANAITVSKIANNAVGASQIAAGAVHTSELNTVISYDSVTAVTKTVILAASDYIFQVRHRRTAGTQPVDFFYSDWVSQTTAFRTLVGHGGRPTNTFTGLTASTSQVSWRYVSTSPPHNTGDGDIPVFIYLSVDRANKKITGVNLSPDPIWLHAGPTNNMPDGYNKDGHAYQEKRILPDNYNALDYIDKLAALRESVKTKVLITEKQKHFDMDDVPHPWLQDNRMASGVEVVAMLDPVCQLTRDLAELHYAGEDVASLLMSDKYIKINNKPLNRKLPKSLLIIDGMWKLTGG